MADKSRYRKISVSTYGDKKFRALSSPQPCGQYLWLWLLTGPKTCVIPGVLYGSGRRAMAESLDWPDEGFSKAFNEVLAQGIADADFSAPLIFLPNAIKYDPPQSPNVITHWSPTWKEIPECELKDKIRHTLKAYMKGLSKGFQEAFEKACPKAMANQEQEQEQEQERTVAPVKPSGMEEKVIPRVVEKPREHSTNGHIPTEPVPQNSDLMVSMLVEAHPRNLSPQRSEFEAMEAIKRELKRFGGEQQAYEYLLERTKLYAKLTANWSQEDKDFIPAADTWFREKRYQVDQKLWVKGEAIPQPANLLDKLKREQGERPDAKRA